MKKWFAVPALLGALACTTPAQAQDRLAASSPWAVDYAQDRCRLARAFGDGAGQVTLTLERFQPGEFLRVVLIGNAIKPYRSAEQLGYSWGPDGSERSGMLMRSQTGDGQGYFDLGLGSLTPEPDFSAGPPPPPPPGAAPAFPKYDPARENAVAETVREFALTKGVSSPLVLATGKMASPLKALQTCTDELVASWGLDAAALAAGTPVMPEGPTTGWLRSGLVPFSAFATLGSAENYIRVMVDEGGKPTGCHHSPNAPAAQYLTKACEDLLARGKFIPAKGPDGTAIKGYWFTNLFMLMPGPGSRR